MELYVDDLVIVKHAMGHLEELSDIQGVFGVEIRIKFDDTKDWAVIGWGESGDPALIRFEEDLER